MANMTENPSYLTAREVPTSVTFYAPPRNNEAAEEESHYELMPQERLQEVLGDGGNEDDADEMYVNE